MHLCGSSSGRTLVIEMTGMNGNGKVNTRDREPAIAVIAVRDGASAAEALAARGFYSEAAAALEAVSYLLHREAAVALEAQIA
jgi:hypothetical protein